MLDRVSVLLVIAGLLFAGVATEVLFRLVPQDNTELQLHEGVPWRDRPRFYYKPAGARTLRGQDYQQKKPANTFRIAVLGDSFSFAPFMQFDDAFPKRLERILNLEGAALRTEVINYGTPSYSTTHEAKVLKRALREDPDLVILQITLNDPEIKPYMPTGMILKQNDQGGITIARPKNWLEENSRVVDFVSSRFKDSRLQSHYDDYYEKLYQDEQAMGSFKRALQQIAARCAKKSKPIVAVVFPLFGFTITDNYKFFPMHQKIHAHLDQLQIPYLDLTKLYKGIPAERLQVIPGEDFHPNEIAHRMAAEEIYTWLTEQRILPNEMVIKDLYKQRTQVDPARTQVLSAGAPIS